MNEYLERVLKHLPAKLKAEIASTGGGYYSIVIPFDQHHIDIPGENGGALLYDNEGVYVAILTNRSNPLTLASFVTKFWELNME